MKKNIIIISGILIIAIVIAGGYFFINREKSLVFNEKGIYDYTSKGVVKDDVHIESTGVILKNMKIDADLYIDETVGDGHVELHNVEVNGTLYVYGGGLETIIIQDGMILKLIGYVDGRVVATNETVIEEVIVKTAGMVLENDETALEAFPDVNIDIENPTLEDKPVILDGTFDEVKVQAGNNVELKEQTQIRYFPLCTCSKEECPENYKTRVRVKTGAKIEEMNINNEVEMNNEGEVNQITYGENITPSGEIKTTTESNNYKPQVINEVDITVDKNGNYSITFETNNEGTLYYVVQPGFDSTGVTMSKEDIIAKKGYEFVDTEGDGNSMKVVSAKNINVSTGVNKASGYMGDSMGNRPPTDGEDIDFDSVIWYVFKDND